jgi:hypothetical protein
MILPRDSPYGWQQPHAYTDMPAKAAAILSRAEAIVVGAVLFQLAALAAL